tara:strand:- start:187 stop:405 length:219 start_codon:yes stop_codon:yes gene_type:complete
MGWACLPALSGIVVVVAAAVIYDRLGHGLRTCLLEDGPNIIISEQRQLCKASDRGGRRAGRRRSAIRLGQYV